MNVVVAYSPRKFTAMVAMLGSDKDGDVLAAARAVDKVLKSHDRDWHDFAKAAAITITEPAKRTTIEPRRPRAKPAAQKDIVMVYSAHGAGCCSALLVRAGALSSGEIAWIISARDRLMTAASADRPLVPFRRQSYEQFQSMFERFRLRGFMCAG